MNNQVCTFQVISIFAYTSTVRYNGCMNKSKILSILVLGILVTGSFIAYAFTEPTAAPTASVSYPPINVGPMTQIREGALGLGDGSARPNTNDAALGVGGNSFYTKGNLGADTLTVRQNATLVGNLNVGGRMIIAGAMRSPQIIVGEPVAGEKDSSNMRREPGYNESSEVLYFATDTTTNLGTGDTCTLSSSSAACPAGSILIKSPMNSGSTVKPTCRYINPVKTTRSLGSC